jgi:DNA topoisomerase I
LIAAKRESDANKLIKAFAENSDIQVLNGRFGPYIKAGKKNVKIPKGKEPASLTLEECIALADATPEKRSRFARRAPAAEPAKTPAKTATRKTARKAAPAKKTTAKKPAAKAVARKAKAAKTATKAKSASKKKK